MKAQVELNLKFDQEIRSKRVTEDSRFLMKYIFAPVSERNALYKARPRSWRWGQPQDFEER